MPQSQRNGRWQLEERNRCAGESLLCVKFESAGLSHSELELEAYFLHLLAKSGASVPQLIWFGFAPSPSNEIRRTMVSVAGRCERQQAPINARKLQWPPRRSRLCWAPHWKRSSSGRVDGPSNRCLVIMMITIKVMISTSPHLL